MLLSRLERQDEPSLPLDILRHPDNAPGHLPHEGFRARHEAEVRPPERQVIPQRLPVADSNVSIVLARRRQNAKRDGIHAGDENAPLLVRNLASALHVLDAAEEVGRLENDRSGLVVSQFFQSRESRQAPFPPEFLDANRGTSEIRLEDCPIFGMNGPRHKDFRAVCFRPQRHQYRLSHRRSSVVERRVAHLHRGQLADQSLVLEHRLEESLTGLRLVGSVGGVKLGSRRQVADDLRDEMVIGACTQKGVAVRQRDVPGSEPLHPLQQLRLGDSVGQVKQRAFQVRNDLFEKLIERVNADFLKHPLQLLLCLRNKVHSACLHRLPVGIGVHQFYQLGRVAQLHFKDPSFAVRIGVEQLRRLVQFLIHLHDFSGER